MKNSKRFFGLISVMCSLFLSACFSELAGDNGTFTINIGGGNSRAIVGGWGISHTALSHTITLTQADDETGKKIIRTAEKGKTTISFSVTPGVWDILVEGMDGARVYAEGFLKNEEIKPGSNEPIEITMKARPVWRKELITGPGTIAIWKNDNGDELRICRGRNDYHDLMAVPKGGDFDDSEYYRLVSVNDEAPDSNYPSSFTVQRIFTDEAEETFTVEYRITDPFNEIYIEDFGGLFGYDEEGVDDQLDYEIRIFN